MCQLCDEANFYMAQLEAAERKAADAKKGDGKSKDTAGGKRDEAAAAVRGK